MAKVIDVRTIMPMDRHRIIFETYDALDSGDSFLLIADHDPVPLHRQFETNCAGGYEWTYVKEGPDTWQVEIGRTQANS
ncbi:MAG: DUF2249 domain-containing protein [Gammaproteobacteria bacterium]